MGTHPIFESDFDCLTAFKMTLESTVICVDNSEYCRNGDYAPTRLLAQRDANKMVARAKLRQNAENTCALLIMDLLQLLHMIKENYIQFYLELNQGVKSSLVLV